MKRSKILVALIASTAIATALMSTAFAAPATGSTCPTKNILNQVLGGSNGASQPEAVSVLPSNLQGLLNQYGLNSQPATGTSSANCPKKAAQAAPAATQAPAATPAPKASPAPTTGTAPVSGSMSADEQKMIGLVNQDRASNGLKPLTFDAALRKGALAHSQDMAQNNYFSHTSPTQGDFSARVKAAGVQYTGAGENIAKYGSVESAEAGFMNSPGHRANILGDFTRVGIGIVNVSGTYYITQWFAK